MILNAYLLIPTRTPAWTIHTVCLALYPGLPLRPSRHLTLHSMSISHGNVPLPNYLGADREHSGNKVQQNVEQETKVYGQIMAVDTKAPNLLAP